MSAPRRYAIVSLTATGPDARVDRVFRLAARIPSATGAALERVWLADPSLGLDPAAEAAVSARIHRLYGVSGADLAARPPATDSFDALREAIGDRTIVCFEREPFLRWWRRLAAEVDGHDASDPHVVGVADLARLLLPGRRSAERERLLELAFSPADAPQGEPAPAEIEALLGAVARAVLSRSEDELIVAASALRHLVSGFQRTDPEAARILEASVDLVDRPSGWCSRGGELFPAAAELVDGELSRHAGTAADAVGALRRATPRASADLDARFAGEPLRPLAQEPVVLGDADRAAIDTIFEEWLPRAMAAVARGADPRAFYREGQHRLARRIGDALGSGELLLVDAPTGTGKTMAYLVPALLWAGRAGVRVGVSTYTIALQEQVFDRELPRALDLLRRAGAAAPEQGYRVSVLKGRERYLCGRALASAAPDPDDAPEVWLAWTLVALFALDDPEGDLDRLSRRLPCFLERGERAEEALVALARDVRCRPRCCGSARDRRRCGAWIARRRAERSHLVVTNHAFVLRDPEFLKNVIADECDHLHPQAKGAGSVELSFRQLREKLVAIVGEGGPGEGRALLPRLARALAQRSLLDAGPLGAKCAAAVRAASGAASAFERLERAATECVAFADELRRESGQEPHRAFERFAREHPAAVDLVGGRCDLVEAASELAGLCDDLAESMEPAAVEDGVRLVGRLRGAASELTEMTAALAEWLPVADGEASFDPSCFHDLEVERGRGRPTLVARRTILLPHRWLAERWLAPLQSATLLSASTWLQGGFDLALGYLGLALVAEGTGDREGRPVATHRAPSSFDYSRVLLAIPDDAPEARFGDTESQARFDRYLVAFLRFLVERTRGRTLALLTNLQQCKRVALALEPFFRQRCIPFFWQGMEGRAKEELPRLFRSADGGLLMGVDTFWYGVDFPGDLLEYLVLAKLPFGPIDRYTKAQEAVLGETLHRQTIYLPEALSMFRQGFGRLMRRETDRGAVFLLDTRVRARWRRFLKELPGREEGVPEDRRLLEVSAATEECVRRALAHCGRLEECRRLGLALRFEGGAV